MKMTTNRFSKFPLTLDIQFFADDIPEGGGAGQESNPGDTPPKTVTLTQDELDALIIREKGRVKAKYADYDDLKAKAAEFEAEKQRIEDEKLSDMERLQKQLEEKEQAGLALAEKVAAFEKAEQDRKFKQAFTETARGLEVASPEVAFRLADLDGLEMGEDGKIGGLEERLLALKETYDFLNVPKAEPKKIGGGDLNPDTRAEKTLEQQLEDAKKERNFAKVVEISNKLKSL